MSRTVLSRWNRCAVGVAIVPAATHTACADLPPARQSAASVGLQEVASFDHQVTGVAVAPNGRIFVNFPRWTEDTATSVAEWRDGQVVPFPDAEWNTWRNARKDEVSPKNHWVCVQSMVTAPNGNRCSTRLRRQWPRSSRTGPSSSRLT